MRTAAQVLLGYVLLLLLGALWRLTGLDHAVPNILALASLYLGLTARERVAPAVTGALALGYLADLLGGNPRGVLAFTGAIVCVFGHLIRRRLLLRGRVLIVVLSFVTALLAGVAINAVRLSFGLAPDGLRAVVEALLWSALMTAIVGPPVFRLCRTVDARFARTYREREAALEGLVP